MASNAQASLESWMAPNLSINDEPAGRKVSEGSYQKTRKMSSMRKGPYSADCTPVLRRSQSVTPHR